MFDEYSASLWLVNSFTRIYLMPIRPYTAKNCKKTNLRTSCKYLISIYFISYQLRIFQSKVTTLKVIFKCCYHQIELYLAYNSTTFTNSYPRLLYFLFSYLSECESGSRIHDTNIISKHRMYLNEDWICYKLLLCDCVRL